MKREKELAKNTAILALGTFLPKLSSIVILPIITAGLTKAEYGTYDLINTLVSLVLPIVTLQIQSAAFRFLIDCRYDESETRRIISNIYAFILPVSLVSLAILYLLLFSLSRSIRVLICLYFFIDLLMLATQQIVRGLSNNKLYSKSYVIQSFVNVILVIFTVGYLKQGLLGVLVSITVATFVGLCILFVRGGILGKIDFSLVSLKVLKEMLSYSWPMIPNSLSNWILSLSDRLVLTIFMGIEANAIYAAANKIPSLFSTVQGTFVFAWQENASIAVKDDDNIEYYSSMFDKIYSVLCGIMAMLIAVTPFLFELLIKGDYNESYFQMPILYLGVFFCALSAFMGGIYVAHKRTKSVGISTLCAASLNLTLDLVLVNGIGIYAASVSTLVSYLFLAIYRMIDVNKFQKLKFNIPKIILGVGILITMCVLCWMNSFLTTVLNIIIGIVFAFSLNHSLIRSVIEILKKKFVR